MILGAKKYLIVAFTLFLSICAYTRNDLTLTANFSINGSDHCQNTEVTFVDLSVTTGPPILRWEWDFGDGGTSNEQNPSHIYETAGDFTVELIVIDTEGLSSTFSSSITINPAPLVDFDITSTDNCISTEQIFDSNVSVSTGSIDTYRWEFGDGSISNDIDATHTYGSPGTYDVTLIATSNVGCSSSITKEITIYEEPIASFAFENVCLGSDMSFVNTSTITNGNLTYSWDFGDGIGTSSLTNPEYKYITAGDYTVTLTAISNNGSCSVEFGQPVTVFENPEADFSFDNQCFGNVVEFNNESDGGVNPSYLWNFGDGKSSTELNPSNDYDLPGSYLVSLTVTSDDGCEDVSTQRVDIFDNPAPTFFVADNCLENTVEFTNLTNEEGDTYSYEWDFGDGEGSMDQNPTHVYDDAGTYTVLLTATTSNGCEATYEDQVVVWDHPVAAFAFANGCDGVENSFTNNSIIPGAASITSYTWDYGDGSGSTSITGSHTYDEPGIYNVTLTAVSENGCEDQITQPITIFAKPVTNFSFSGACNGNTISFINESTTSEGNLNYIWSFGDGNTSNEVNPSHQYATQGTYTVSLEARNNLGGCFTILEKEVDVFQELTSDFTFQPVCFGGDVTFDNTSVGTGVTFSWNFGDGNTSSFFEPSHTYESPGSYIVRLTVMSNDGCERESEKRVDIYENPTPIFFFDNSCEQDEVLFTNLTDVGLDSPSYEWDFGDGSSSAEREPVHVYGEAGIYNVSLTVSTEDNCQTTVSNDIEIFEIPVVDFTIEDVCFGFPSEFTNQSTGEIESYLWDFGDLTNSTSENPTKQYLSPGTYNVTLTIVSSNGCTNSITKQANVNELPVADFDALDVCLNESTAFTDRSIDNSGTTSFLWDFGDGTTSVAQNPTHTYSLPGTYAVNLTVTSSEGCVDTSSKLVVVFDLPEANAGQDTTVSRGASIELQASGGVSYRWSPIAGLSNSTVANPIARPLENTVYTVTVTDQNGCQNTDEVAVTVREDFIVVATNVFTPDGNGQNDQWIIPNADAFDKVEVKVYDRYGVLVFEDPDYQNDWEGTRGTDILPDGTYYYLITFPGTDINYSGALTLLRNR